MVKGHTHLGFALRNGFAVFPGYCPAISSALRPMMSATFRKNALRSGAVNSLQLCHAAEASAIACRTCCISTADIRVMGSPFVTCVNDKARTEGTLFFLLSESGVFRRYSMRIKRGCHSGLQQRVPTPAAARQAPQESGLSTATTASPEATLVTPSDHLGNDAANLVPCSLPAVSRAFRPRRCARQTRTGRRLGLE